MATPHALTKEETYAIADSLAQASSLVLDLRIRQRATLSQEEQQLLEKHENHLDMLVSLFRAYGIYLITEDAQQASSELLQAINKGKARLKRITDIKAGMDPARLAALGGRGTMLRAIRGRCWKRPPACAARQRKRYASLIPALRLAVADHVFRHPEVQHRLLLVLRISHRSFLQGDGFLHQRFRIFQRACGLEPVARLGRIAAGQHVAAINMAGAACRPGRQFQPAQGGNAVRFAPHPVLEHQPQVIGGRAAALPSRLLEQRSRLRRTRLARTHQHFRLRHRFSDAILCLRTTGSGQHHSNQNCLEPHFDKSSWYSAKPLPAPSSAFNKVTLSMPAACASASTFGAVWNTTGPW